MNAAVTHRRRPEPMVEGEFPFTIENFRKIATLLRDESGIHMPEAKATLVYSRLAKRLRTLKLADFDEYCALISSSAGAEERSAMFAALTTNVTRFFREPHHFDHFRDKVLPPLIGAARAGSRVRFWSSACSTGQEPYSMALTLLEAMPDAGRFDIRILATDIDLNVVATAKLGVYGNEAVSPIPVTIRDRWMTRERGGGDGQWRVGDAARELVTFRGLNLIGDWPMKGRFDAIFCRNVVIYFEEATQNRIWGRFRSCLTANGRLYIGHSERVDASGFVSDGLTVYRLGGGAS